ncbi:MAG TPA: hypothetical protein PLV68_13675, partial [Ilumatobacteraceae bacterium]|nr:hypothetical protein [Ilumatobacteraceae bacterium]
TDLGDVARQMVGSLGWLEFSAPWVAQAMWWALLVGAAIGVASGARGGQRRLLGAWGCVVAITVVTPVVFETVFAGRVGFIWQGRYSIPTALGAVVFGVGTWSRCLSRR